MLHSNNTQFGDICVAAAGIVNFVRSDKPIDHITEVFASIVHRW
jgi:hypothetical protein